MVSEQWHDMTSAPMDGTRVRLKLEDGTELDPNYIHDKVSQMCDSDSRQAGALFGNRDAPRLPFNVRGKNPHDAVNHIRHLMERWDDRPKIDASNLAERYRNGDIEFIARFDAVEASGKIGNFLAIFRSNNWHVFKEDNRDGVRRNVRMAKTSDRTDGDKELVFIHDVEVMDGAEYSIPSFVRFESFENFDNLWSGPVHVSLFNGCTNVFSLFAEREVDTIGIATRVCSEKVERTSKVVNGIAHKEGHLFWDILPDPDYKLDPLPVRLRFGNDSIRVSFAEIPDLRFKLVDMAFGPINL